MIFLDPFDRRFFHEPIVPQARLTLVAYILIAIYAAASIALRLRAARAKK